MSRARASPQPPPLLKTSLIYFGAARERLSWQRGRRGGERITRILDLSIQYRAAVSEWDAEEVS
jgi:hypothetical protein